MQPDSPEFQGFALLVKSQHEKSVASVLHGKGYEKLLPLYSVSRRWSDRIKQLALPLFPGYVFCRFDLNKRLGILVTPGVLQVVGAGKVPLPVDDREIEAVRSIVKSGLQAEPWPFLKVGQRVSIERGSLEGVEGILLAIKKPYRLIVSVTLLQRSVAVELDQDWATPLCSVVVTGSAFATEPDQRGALISVRLKV